MVEVQCGSRTGCTSGMTKNPKVRRKPVKEESVMPVHLKPLITSHIIGMELKEITGPSLHHSYY